MATCSVTHRCVFNYVAVRTLACLHAFCVYVCACVCGSVCVSVFVYVPLPSVCARVFELFAIRGQLLCSPCALQSLSASLSSSDWRNPGADLGFQMSYTEPFYAPNTSRNGQVCLCVCACVWVMRVDVCECCTEG